jgi:6-phospho-beta-glucosidase
MILAAGKLPWLPFDAEFINSLGMVPNEYLYYYYNTREAIKNITSAGQARSEQIAAMNHQLYTDLKRLQSQDNRSGMLETYYRYMNQRGETYMTRETGIRSNLSLLNKQIYEATSGEGYAGVALDLIESLCGESPRVMILIVTNLGAITGMEDKDVVEIPAYVGRDLIRPIIVGKIPDHCLGLIKQVKAYEHLTIEAALEKSYSKAITALAIHPLVPNYTIAKTILDEYIIKHQPYFPILN